MEASELHRGARGLAGDELRGEAAELEREADQLAARVKALRFEAAKLRSRAERLDDPARGVRIKATARDRVRGDGLLAAAGVACEDLDAGFKPADLAAALGIRDEPRALKLLLALAELGKVTKLADGWMVYDAEEARVRDYIVEHRRFTLGDVIAACAMSELDASYYVGRFRDVGIVIGGGGHFEYVEPERRTGGARPRRRPPEQDPPAYTDVPKRGEALYIADHGKRGKLAQRGGRHQMKQRDARREAQENARRERAEQQAAKSKRGKRK